MHITLPQRWEELPESFAVTLEMAAPFADGKTRDYTFSFELEKKALAVSQ